MGGVGEILSGIIRYTMGCGGRLLGRADEPFADATIKCFFSIGVAVSSVASFEAPALLGDAVSFRTIIRGPSSLNTPTAEEFVSIW